MIKIQKIQKTKYFQNLNQINHQISRIQRKVTKLKLNELHVYKTKIFYVRNNEKLKEN